MKPQPRQPTIPKATSPDPTKPRDSRQQQAQSPATPATTAITTNRSAPPTASQTKLTIRMDPTDLGRARTAWRIACAQPGDDYPTFGRWVANQVMAATERIEAEHNAGVPFTPTPAGVIPTGTAPR
jgi:hypothetical protein